MSGLAAAARPARGSPALTAHPLPHPAAQALSSLLDRSSGLTDIERQQLEVQLSLLDRVVGGCERILRQPMPRAYNRCASAGQPDRGWRLYAVGTSAVHTLLSKHCANYRDVTARWGLQGEHCFVPEMPLLPPRTFTRTLALPPFGIAPSAGTRSASYCCTLRFCPSSCSNTSSECDTSSNTSNEHHTH